MKKFTYDLLLSVCLDERVTDGMFNPSLQEHLDVLTHHLEQRGLERDWIKEYVENIREGKYPERQAYNKEGFLVTFPTPEHKKQALASGEYFQNDPTGGKGGMHLVKKSEPAPAVPVADPAGVAPSQPQAKPQPSAGPVDPTPAKKQPAPTPVPPAPVVPAAPEAPTAKIKAPSTGGDVNTTPADYGGGEEKRKKQAWRAGDEGKKDYVDPSQEWAHNQKWERTPSGNYYDVEGNLKAVTGLDGKVLPVEDADKERYKLWIKNPENRPEMQAKGVGD